MTIKLKPCPFCGETPDQDDPLTFQDIQGAKWGSVVCCCTGPEVRTCYESVEHWRDDAAEAWNTRAGQWACEDCGATFPKVPHDEDVKRCSRCVTVEMQAEQLEKRTTQRDALYSALKELRDYARRHIKSRDAVVWTEADGALQRVDEDA